MPDWLIDLLLSGLNDLLGSPVKKVNKENGKIEIDASDAFQGSQADSLLQIPQDSSTSSVDGLDSGNLWSRVIGPRNQVKYQRPFAEVLCYQ